MRTNQVLSAVILLALLPSCGGTVAGLAVAIGSGAYATATVFAEDIRRHLESEPVKA